MKYSLRGVDREKSLSINDYFSGIYFSMKQLCSLAHQINYIQAMKPKSALEIGIGNGFLSTLLRMSGIKIITADINQNLNPDICAPLSDMTTMISEKTDLVICCEVLEHMPLEDLDENLDYLRELGARLFLTLPNSRRCLGLSGMLHLPIIGSRLFDLHFDTPSRRSIEGGPHFWEVGYDRQCTRRAIVGRLRTRYGTVKCGRFALNPYHIYFICE